MRYYLPVLVLIIGAVIMTGCVGMGSPGTGVGVPDLIRNASVIKLDPNVTVEWQTHVSLGRDTMPSSVVPLPDGACALTGSAVPDGGNFSFPRPFVVMLDENGTTLWNRTLPPTMGLEAGSVAPAPDGGLTVTGSFGHVLHLDANGTVQWERVLLDWTALRTIVPESSGGYLIGGVAHGVAAVAQLNESGQVLWVTAFSDLEDAWAERILPLASGGFAVAGTALNGEQIPSSVWVARLDGDGAILWGRMVEEEGRTVPAIIWDISDLWEADGEIGVVYEVIKTGYTGDCETVVATIQDDGRHADRRTLDAFVPVLRTKDGGYIFAAFPKEGNGWFYYGNVLHIVELDESGAVIRDTPIDLGEGNQTGPFVRTGDGGSLIVVTHGPAGGMAFPSGGGSSAVGIAFRRE
jgi:hypothetical protein